MQILDYTLLYLHDPFNNILIFKLINIEKKKTKTKMFPADLKQKDAI